MPEIYNIKQITSHDLSSVMPSVKEDILIGGDKGTTKNVYYKHVDSALLGEGNIFKFGFCMNSNSGIDFPIYVNGNQFYLGKTGMFEWQTEDWEDVNAETEEEKSGTAIYYATNFDFPVGTTDGEYSNFDFVLDYCY